MTDLEVKICGLSRERDLEAAIAGGASHVGFIFFEPSPRNVAVERAAELAKLADGRASVVAVSVNADDSSLDAIVDLVRPQMLQLHGSETPERVEQIRRRYGLPAMKSFAIREPADLDAIAPYRGIADKFLFDAKAPEGSAIPGGNGVSFDWSLLEGLAANTDYMLSGGINLENVSRALEVARPCGIDISSGVESSPGQKDPARISAFLRHVREIEQSLAV